MYAGFIGTLLLHVFIITAVVISFLMFIANNFHCAQGGRPGDAQQLRVLPRTLVRALSVTLIDLHRCVVSHQPVESRIHIHIWVAHFSFQLHVTQVRALQVAGAGGVGGGPPLLGGPKLHALPDRRHQERCPAPRYAYFRVSVYVLLRTVQCEPS